MIIMGKKVKRLYVSVQCTVMFSVFSVKNKLAKLGDAIAISKSETLNH